LEHYPSAKSFGVWVCFFLIENSSGLYIMNIFYFGYLKCLHNTKAILFGLTELKGIA